MEKLPYYHYQITRESLEAGDLSNTPVSLVDSPAILIDFMKFNQNEPFKFKINSKEKRELVGPGMIPNLPIYRYSEDRGEHMAVFTEQDIETWFEFNMEKGLFNNISLMHNGEKVEGIFVKEVYLTGKNDKSKDLGFDLPEGSIMFNFKCSVDLWSKIDEMDLKGFSIECYANPIHMFGNLCSIKQSDVQLAKIRKAIFEDELDSIQLSNDFALEYYNKPCRCSNCRQLKDMGYCLPGVLPEGYNKQYKIS